MPPGWGGTYRPLSDADVARIHGTALDALEQIGLAEIDAMHRVTTHGAVIAPLSPGLYLAPESIDDLIDFMAGRLLDLLGVEHDLDIRWDETLAARRERNGKVSTDGGG